MAVVVVRTPRAWALGRGTACRALIARLRTGLVGLLALAALGLGGAAQATPKAHVQLASVHLFSATSGARAPQGFEAVVHRRAKVYAPLMDEAARRHGVDPLLLHALAYVETGYRPGLRSRAGALGLMQVLPETAKRFGVKDSRKLMQPVHSVHAGAGYLRWLLDRFDNDLPLAVAAYNAGEGAVERFGYRVPPYRETRAYVRAVLARYEKLRTSAAQVARDEGGVRLL